MVFVYFIGFKMKNIFNDTVNLEIPVKKAILRKNTFFHLEIFDEIFLYFGTFEAYKLIFNKIRPLFTLMSVFNINFNDYYKDFDQNLSIFVNFLTNFFLA